MGRQSVANLVRVNLLSLTVTMVKTLLVLTTLIACISADVFTASKSFQVKVGKTKKTANCDFTISYSGDTASKAGSNVKCSIAWPKNSALSSTKTLSFTVGDVAATIFTAEVTFSLVKKKNKPASTTKTTLKTVNSVPITGDASFYPATLWCPEENTLIYGSGSYDSIVNEAAADSWDMCAQRCAEYTNDSGNSPCFSWTFNSNADAVLGLNGGTCRLLAYMEVSSIAAAGVQSGYHKCWNAYVTSTAP